MIKFPPSRIEVFRPAIGEEEIAAATAVLRSGWIGRGPKVAEFEREWARHIGVAPEHVVSVGCATEALYQVMAWLGNRPDQEIIIPDNSFIGTASAVLESGMTVQLCDADTMDLNPSAISYHVKRNESTVGLVFQHYGGFEGQRDLISSLCRKWGISLIEDMACHPMGRPVGDYAVWSFDAMKVLTCGDGGMVYCRDADAAAAIRQATRLGMSSESGQLAGSANWWEFSAHVPGRRSIMNDIGAAIGLVQLRRLPELVARRQMIWESYQKQLDAPVHYWYDLPPQPAESAPASYYTYWIQCPETAHRDALAVYLRERGVYSTYRYWSISKAYNWDVSCPNSHWASMHTLNLPLHPSLTDDDITYICELICDFGKTL